MAEVFDVRRQAPGLVVARSMDRLADYGTQLWAEVKSRQHATCKLTGGPIKPGSMVYRPHTNLGNRSWRVLSVAMNALAPDGVETGDGSQQREVTAREIYEGWRDQKGWVPWVEGGNSLMQDKARREAALGVNPTDGGKHD